MSATFLLSLEAGGLPPKVEEFLETHCVECHDDVASKGDFDAYALDPTFASAAGLDQWVRVFDRVHAGEMPPPKKPQPGGREKIVFLELIEPRIVAGDKKRREVVQRRLNRDEYHYSIRDLLHIDLDP